MRLRYAVPLGLLLAARSLAAEDEAAFRSGTRVRLLAASATELPGVVELSGHSIKTRGHIVANTEKLVAVRVESQETAVCLLRPGSIVTGRLVGADAEALTLKVDGQRDPFRIPRNTLAGVDVSQGANRGKAVLKGAAFGLLGFGAIGAVLGDSCEGEWMCPGAGAGALMLGTLGASIGALVGVAAGDGKWQPVSADRVRVSLRPELGRRRGLTVAVSF